jgi:inhibitor of KinA
MVDYRVLPAGDTALVVEFGNTIDRGLSNWVLALGRRLNDAKLDGIVETVPTFRSLMIYFDPLVLPAEQLNAAIADWMQGLQAAEQTGRTWRLPACYAPEIAPDLDAVAERTGLTPAQVVELHSAVTYHVYMLGFLPGQAYMGDLPAELMLPRREAPRTRVPAGSLAIAKSMTCIFPLETPCGWHLIGRSPVALWEQGAHPKALLEPGDRVSFTPISLHDYEVLRQRAANGDLVIKPEDDAVGAAA